MSNGHAFPTPAALEVWLAANHKTSTELFVRIYKKDSGVPSVTWNDVVIAVLAWGWIDGQKRSLDADSYLQRITPRRPRSSWSKKNCAHAERLIAEGHMQPSGLAEVEAAKANGRWEKAYAGSATMTFPDAFLAALESTPKAKAAFAALDQGSRFRIYHRLHSAVRPETVTKRIEAFVDQLTKGEPIT